MQGVVCPRRGNAVDVYFNIEIAKMAAKVEFDVEANVRRHLCELSCLSSALRAR